MRPENPPRRRVVITLAYVLVPLLTWSMLSWLPVSGAAASLHTQSTSEAKKSLQVPHVFIVVMENEESSSIVGSPSAPFLNKLIQTYGYARNYYGITHPSLPNYVAMIAGDYFNVRNDAPSNRFDAPSVVDQLQKHHLTWKAYMEDLPSRGYQGDYAPTTGIALYARKHDPFMLMNGVLRDPARLLRVVPATQLDSDLHSGHVPNLAFLSPNLCHDMHGIEGSGSPCPPDRAQLIRTGDSYLAELVPRIMSSSAWSGGSMIVVTFDEGSSNTGCCGTPANGGGGKVVTIVIARTGVRHFVSDALYNHYSLLRTLEKIWRLGCLANTCRNDVKPMLEFLASHRRPHS